MPLLFLRVDEAYLPDDPRAWAEPLNQRHELTHNLLNELDSMIADVISEVDGKMMTSDQVAIYPEVNHPWARNAATFCFDLQPGNGGLMSSVEQQRRRMRIEELLGKKLDEFFEKHTRSFELSELPSFDVECRPISASGHHHGCGGRNVMQYKSIYGWGQIEPDVAH